PEGGPGRGRAHEQLVLREVVVLGGDDRHELDGELGVVLGELLCRGADPLLFDRAGAELLERDPDRARVAGAAGGAAGEGAERDHGGGAGGEAQEGAPVRGPRDVRRWGQAGLLVENNGGPTV